MAELIESLLAEIERLKAELAASQAREKVILDALRECYRQMVCQVPTNEIRYAESLAYRAINQTTEYSALHDLLKAERERCVKIIDDQMIGFAEQDKLLIDMVKAVRSLGEE